MFKFVVTYASLQLREAVNRYISEHLLSENSFVNLAIIEKVGNGAALDQLIGIATRVVTNAQLPDPGVSKPTPVMPYDMSLSRPKIMLRYSTVELRNTVVEAADENFMSVNKFINIAIAEKLARAKALQGLVELAYNKLLANRGSYHGD